MKFQSKLLATAALFAVSASCAYASTFYLNPGADLDSAGAVTDADTKTGNFSFMNFNPNATSVYTQRSVASGYTAATGMLTNGDVIDFIDTGIVNVGSFNDSFGTTDKFMTSFEGFGDSWQLRVEYSVSGSSVVSGLAAPVDMTNVADHETFALGTGLIPTFDSSGRFNIFISDIGADDVPELSNQKVLQLNVNQNANITPGNLELAGTVDYSWLASSGYTAPQITAIENFFNLTDGTSFYESWANSIPVTWQIQTNVEPNLIPRNNVAPNGSVGKSNVKDGLNPNVACAAGTFCRTTSLNMDVEFVPEPEMILMLGLGMIGLGYVNKNRKTRSWAAAC